MREFTGSQHSFIGQPQQDARVTIDRHDLCEPPVTRENQIGLLETPRIMLEKPRYKTQILPIQKSCLADGSLLYRLLGIISSFIDSAIQRRAQARR